MEEDIITLFDDISRRNGTIKLLNIYKGLPISYEATIVSVSPPVVTVHCNKYQFACLLLEKGCYIQGDDITGTIRGQLYAIHPEKEQAELTNLIYVNGGIGMRSQVRVESDNPVWALVRGANMASPVMAILCDISSTGVSVYLEKFYYRSSVYKPGSQVSVTLELPWTGSDAAQPVRTTSALRQTGLEPEIRFSREALRGIQSLGADAEREPHREKAVEIHDGIVRIAAQGVVKNVIPELVYNRYRIGLQLDLDANGKQAITQFIAQRQAEIIKEFRLIYASLVGRHIT